MKDMKNKAVGYILVVVAVVVILESVVLVSGLGEKETTVSENKETEKGKVAVTEVKSQPAEAVWVFQSESGVMEVGKRYRVAVNLLPNKGLAVDAVELFVKYPADQVKIGGMKDGKGMPKSVMSKVSEKVSMVIGKYMVLGQPLMLVKDQPMEVLSFEVQPVKTGVFSLEISGSEGLKETATLVTENASARAIPYESNKLMITVER